MSESEDAPDSISDHAYSTTSGLYEGHADAGMSVIGWLIALGVFLVALPLLPFIALAWLATRVL
jgi:hypothetical protein